MSGFSEQIMHAVQSGSFCARRDFLKAAVALPFILRAANWYALDLTITIAHDDPNADALLGARMSVSEAQRAAQLLGVKLTVHEVALSGRLAEQDVMIVASDHEPGIRLKQQFFRILSPGCVAWKPELEAFGGAQLNARYQSAYHKPMTPAAWAGWLAVKIVWETATRIESNDPDKLAAFLTSPRGAFDGHRGQLLRFDAQTLRLGVPCLS